METRAEGIQVSECGDVQEHEGESNLRFGVRNRKRRDEGSETEKRGEGKHKGSGPFAVRYETSPLFLIEEWAGRIRAVLKVQTTARGPQERTTL